MPRPRKSSLGRLRQKTLSRYQRDQPRLNNAQQQPNVITRSRARLDSVQDQQENISVPSDPINSARNRVRRRDQDQEENITDPPIRFTRSRARLAAQNEIVLPIIRAPQSSSIVHDVEQDQQENIFDLSLPPSVNRPQQDHEVVHNERDGVAQRPINHIQWRNLKKSAFRYDLNVNYKGATYLGSMIKICQYCHAVRFSFEAPGMCCQNGRVNLPPLALPPFPVKALLDYSHPSSVEFHNHIKAYNAAFQMTSFGAKEERFERFPSTFKIQGQVYHQIGSLLPELGQQPSYLQIYFLDNADNQTERRMEVSPNLDRGTVRQIQDMLHDNNLLLREFKVAVSSTDLTIRINAVAPPAGQHPGRYNAPTTNSNDVAALIVNQDAGQRDIILKRNDNRLQRIVETHRSYDALQYPIIFCYGEDGYSIDLKLQPPKNSRNQDSTDVNDNTATKGHLTSRMFYAYRIMIRPGSNQNQPQLYRTLFNQYLVDMYAKIESERLLFIRRQQRQLRAGNYNILDDAFRNDNDAANLGQLVVLPSTFTGGPRYMQKKTQDACAYIRKFGRASLFVTMTCNPKWKEITDALPPHYQPFERHDIVTRVFNGKLKRMMELIITKQIFGQVNALLVTTLIEIYSPFFS